MTGSGAARVLIADDHAVVRAGLTALIDREPDLEVVAEAEDGRQALQLGLNEQIDVAILDIAMPGLTGLQATREIRRKREFPILILSMYDREQYFFEAIAAGAAGYVLKRQVDQDIIEACRAALRGEPFIYPSALGALMRRYLSMVDHDQDTGAGPLTPRETEVVKLIAEGHNSQQIADLLSISLKTVDRHRTNLLEKLNMNDRVDVTRYAIRSGLVEP
ncbi:MAG: response regulator transcription factor [Nocardioidaceae bacterium]|nr:response regulator transcription factor [Nocardioidaceae bacterium]